MAAVRASSSRCDFPAALSLWVWLRENETSACVAVVNGSERLRVHWLLSSCTSLSLSQEMLQGHVEGRRDVGILGEALPTSAPKGARWQSQKGPGCEGRTACPLHQGSRSPISVTAAPGGALADRGGRDISACGTWVRSQLCNICQTNSIPRGSVLLCKKETCGTCIPVQLL